MIVIGTIAGLLSGKTDSISPSLKSGMAPATIKAIPATCKQIKVNCYWGLFDNEGGKLNIFSIKLLIDCFESTCNDINA